MKNSPSIPFFVIMFLIRSITGSVRDGFLQPYSSFKEDGVLNVSISTVSRSKSIIEENVCFANSSCLEGTGYSQVLKQLTKYAYSPVRFNLDIPGVNTKCKVQSLQYQRALDLFEMWALKMYDSNAKIPSGILNGNINQLGDFDLCLSVDEKKLQLKGQYCLASLQIKTPLNGQLSAIHKLVHSHYMLKSNLDDPGHRVPRFSSINWAICVPNLCEPGDVHLAVQKAVDAIFNGTNLDVEVMVDPIMCQTAQSEELSWLTYLVGIYCTNQLSQGPTINIAPIDFIISAKLYVAFSLKKNLSALFSTRRSSDDIEALHGIRFINAFMLVISHKSMASFFVPYVNRTSMSEIMGKPWTVIGRAASLYTDPFVMMSGMLTTHCLLKKLNNKRPVNILQEYVSRLFRIVPTLGALILFCTFILPSVSSGPNWKLVVTHHADICKRYWWRNMLFIHNYFGFKNMCLTHTHHVGLDTQLFLVAIIVVPLVWRWPKRGLASLFVLAGLSTALRYYATYSRKLSNFVHFGTSIEQLFDTADHMYILPIHRATVYILGVLLAFLQCNYQSVNLSKSQIRLGNTLSLLCLGVSFLGPSFMGSIDYVYNPTDAAWYAAFAPIFWCLAFAWIIFTAHTKQTGFIGKILSHKFFLITTRLSYSIYLTQFPIFFYNVGTTRNAEYYDFISKTLNVAEWLWIILCSILLSLLFELPFQNIRDIILKKGERLQK
ncbi:hypothetical protein PPYR_08835 [Photinus pyralis]|uniref:Nose resistant-to-fluoxetine protein N-terminal domain-containing protein n=1 Tax=Photinus pyralis TaxID=7054 RepID=A0A5N4AKF7_PHOPY|nr:hypothetical protein PPYR_08835 [Photinus pyralis]